jgi:hypothetical protein
MQLPRDLLLMTGCTNSAAAVTALYEEPEPPRISQLERAVGARGSNRCGWLGAVRRATVSTSTGRARL